MSSMRYGATFRSFSRAVEERAIYAIFTAHVFAAPGMGFDRKVGRLRELPGAR